MLETIVHAARRHTWLVLLVFAIGICLFPVGYRITRICLLVSVAVLWIWGAFLIRRRKGLAATILIAGLACLAWLCLPGTPGDAEALQRSYVQCMKQYEGTRYVWGGENRIGIDCSGLVRRGLINANFKTGLRTFNPQLVRAALVLWWNDCSALALRDGYRGFTKRRMHAESINSIDPVTLAPGDLAVTANGVHVLAYLGDKTWIEADPGVLKVISVAVPADNVWFMAPVQIVRWNQLAQGAY